MEKANIFMRNLLFPLASGVFLALLLSACATPPSDQSALETAVPDDSSAGNSSVRLTATPLPAPATTATDRGTAALAPRTGIILPGTGNFIDKKMVVKPVPVTQAAPGEVTLNFEGADIRDVIKVIFDTLKENYTVDPQVQGEVTVQTLRPLSRDQVLPTLETLLRMNNAVLVREAGINKILPMAGAVKQGGLTPRLGGSGVGYGVRIVPLRYISATEMQTIVAPFLPEGGVVRADVLRNLLILAGTPQELANVQSTIDTFDVNWLKGMSIGMFRLRNVESQAMATNLNQLLGEGSGTPIAGLLRFVPLSKLNAVLVITPQVEYLKEVAMWIERLDGVGGERLYVYAVQNSRADYVADLLNGLFNLGSSSGTRGGEVAPGLKPAQLSGGLGSSSGLSGGGSGLSGGGSGLASGSGGSSALGGSSSSGATSSAGSNRPGGKTSGSTSSGSNPGGGGPSAGMEEVRIVADTENNALLIWATSQNYERIVNTLEKMDVSPRQVLIEATIAEVTLSGRLKYGLQWFFNNNVGRDYDGNGSLGLPNNLTLTDALKNIPAGQFSYAITDSAGIVKALLTALASDSKIKVLSSPQVMVADNQQAVIRVGTQQPIPSGTSTVNNVTTTGGVTYKDTGVLLDVLPRINSGGMVNMEIKQEVIDVGPIDSATSQRSFLQRSVTSKVVVKSGQTLVLGGLIRDNRTEGQSGIPVLYKIPVLGALFGNTEELVDRTELIVLITPRVVRDSQEADQVTEEIKRKMQEVAPLVRPSAG
ncbi:putative General secretion pathway protein D [Candidatus Contendobacter odensis Run_B_J11]|uniref:General secretion pathway protein D n=2 Tax=Candidatus Contendibacter odensensis TaxID=1400860 RepID=A0A7U7G996_9GAMM|nr:putative General secretion pathway protein D [Candidatus Contendobacter odensis Run_B_J11]